MKTSPEALFIVHDTADGLVYCQTVKLAHRKWMAGNWGDQLQGSRECKTMREANEHAVTAFSRNVPGALESDNVPEEELRKMLVHKASCKE